MHSSERPAIRTPVHLRIPKAFQEKMTKNGHLNISSYLPENEKIGKTFSYKKLSSEIKLSDEHKIKLTHLTCEVSKAEMYFGFV